MQAIPWTFWIFWALAFPAFPVGGLAAAALTGPVTDGPRGVFAGVITGTVLGLVQWLVLRQTLPNSEAWMLVIPLAWMMGWFITRRIGVDLKPKRRNIWIYDTLEN